MNPSQPSSHDQSAPAPLDASDPGLRAPDAPILHAIDPPRRWSPGKIALHSLGFLIGIGLLVWAVALALSRENATELDRAGGASPAQLAALAGLSALSIVLNGLMFWITLRPERRLRPLDVIATNAVAVFLSILPFKLGLITRLLIHHRRDGVNFRLLLAWFAAMSALALAFIVPLCAASLWRGRIDFWWWIVAVGGTIACNLFGWFCGRAAERHRWLSRLSLGADRIVRNPRTILQHALIRTIDVIVLTTRFLVAGWIVGLDLSTDRAALYATTYFLLSVISPAGVAGVREMGVAGVSALTQADYSAIALVTLMVTGAETAVSFVMALGAAAWLRLDRLFLRRPAPRAPASPPADPA